MTIFITFKDKNISNLSKDLLPNSLLTGIVQNDMFGHSLHLIFSLYIFCHKCFQVAWNYSKHRSQSLYLLNTVFFISLILLNWSHTTSFINMATKQRWETFHKRMQCRGWCLCLTIQFYLERTAYYVLSLKHNNNIIGAFHLSDICHPAEASFVIITVDVHLARPIYS